MKYSILLSTLILISNIIFGQIKAPDASPAATIIQNVGFTKVTLEYSRPQLKGRDMFADLTREGEVWRTGANMSTKLTLSEEITVEGNAIAAGEYSIYSIPGKKEWTIIINKKVSWGTQYDESEDLLRFNVPTQKSAGKVESFAFYFDDVTEESGTLGFAWGNAKVEMKLESPTHEKVLAMIDKTMANLDDAGNGDFYAASNYYLEKGLDSKKALTWANEYVKRESDKYWGYRLQARALAANGKYQEAIDSANKSTEMAKEAGNMDYVYNNGKSVEEWKKAMAK